MSREKIERFAAFVAKDPQNPLHNFALARALLQAGEFAEAESAFVRCLELDPDWMVAHIQRGRCLVELERWDEARAALERGADLATAQGHEEPFAEIRELLERIPD
ncbi:MAG: tetratricopeptide repeat protein [Planctomycetes bacterium]|nr:tetratricopeptide repeat protein [Planctomycetota bacterium]